MKKKLDLLIEQTSLKNELVKILNSISNKLVTDFQLRHYIATKLVEIGYNDVDVFDVGISIGLKSYLYASIKIVDINIDTIPEEENNLINELNGFISANAKQRFIIFTNKSNKAKIANLLEQKDNDYICIDLKNMRLFVLEPLKKQFKI